jgi:hypothetical protein
LKSTGPRTAERKRRVALNARKYGIFSRHLLINDREGGEHAREYRRLHSDIANDYAAEGSLEQLWVDSFSAEGQLRKDKPNKYSQMAL